MIFKAHLNKKKGNLPTSTVVGVFGLLTAYGLLQSGLNVMRNSVNTNAETKLMVDAHSFAALFKKNIAKNYTTYYLPATVGSDWGKCSNAVASRSPNDFLAILANTKTGKKLAACNALTLQFDDFKAAVGGATAISMTDLLTTELTPNTPLNEFEHRFKITEYNTSVDRNHLIGDLTVSGRELKVPKTIRIIIDVDRVINPRNNAAAQLCRNIAGSICDGFASTPIVALPFYFLEASGRIMVASHNEGTGVTVITEPSTAQSPNPLAESVKNIDTARTDYRNDSFCITAIQSTPLLYIVDAAKDKDGGVYYLTTHGKLLDANGLNVWTTPDPKFTSFGFDNQYWWFLRSDGTVFKTTDITNQSSLVASGIAIQTAKALAVGAGPEKCN